ncbi:DUF5689 domain-containing protein [Porphyromonas somerae]|uniref:DUF5689 domain-containing protein n=1 Tax=Porphyromonas somerae TaxID=322095 RepID=UPI001FCBD2FF|nr:DUF5689 domain-containing protein [Porphyromonas somerae]BDE82279.1 hypothetical protein CE91St14_13070 [Porphyromonas somerae]
MKLNRQLIIALVALIGLTFASCEREYDAPLLTEPTVEIGDEGIITIAKYKEMFTSVPEEGKIIEEDFAIRAVVVGNDISGNIYKQIYVEDATGGLSIGIDQNNIANDYPVGQEVVIKLQGLAATSYGGVIQLGMNNNNPKNTRIPYEIAKKHLLKNQWPDAKKAMPKVTTMGSITDAMIGTLIQLEGVYFEKGGELNYADQEMNAVNRILRDKSGKSLYVRNSKYATFANDKLPKGNGTVVAILSKFGSDYQLFLRSADDCFGFSGKEPETSGGTDTPTPDQPSTGAVIYSEEFAKDLGKMTPISVAGTQTWRVNTAYKNANMSGFADGKSNANEDWLVSPAFDLTAAKSFSISFEHTINKGNVANMKSEQTLWASDNYSGDVKSATWTQVTITTYPTGTDWNYVKSGAINLPASLLGKANVVFAFKYLATDASSANWQIRALKVTSDGGKLTAGGTTPTPQPQPEPNPNPNPEQPATGKLLFPGADFEDWSLMEKGKSLLFPLGKIVEQSPNGRNGKALHINGTPAGNDYMITAAGAGEKSGSTITLYINGKAGKSLSFMVYKVDGSLAVFNLDEFGTKGHVISPADGEIILKPTEKTFNDKPANSYANGSIDTQGKWLKITLDISSFSKLAKEKNLFSIKVGKAVAYDLLIDDITIQ